MKHAHGPYAPRMRVLSSVCRRWVEKVELVVLPEEKKTTRRVEEKIAAFVYLLPSRAVLTRTPALAAHFIHDLHLGTKHLLLVPTPRASIQRDSTSMPTSATRVYLWDLPRSLAERSSTSTIRRVSRWWREPLIIEDERDHHVLRHSQAAARQKIAISTREPQRAKRAHHPPAPLLHLTAHLTGSAGRAGPQNRAESAACTFFPSA